MAPVAAWLLPSLAALCSAAGIEATPAGGLTDSQLQSVRDGFDQRVAVLFEAQRGKPLVRAEKQPPLRKGAGDYTRHYSFSIVEFATRCFVLNEQIEEANAALVENAQYYLDHPNDLNDRDSVHWHSEMLCRLIDMYGTHGSVKHGRIAPETEKLMMEAMWGFASRRMAMLEGKLSGPWDLFESENHHVQNISTLWHFNKLAAESPGFRDRKLGDGRSPAEHYARWTEYLKTWLTERGKKGMFVEVASDGYNSATLKGIYNIYDFADDPELKRRAGMLLDLFWALWAQEQIDGVLGGGKARVYQSGGDRQGRAPVSELAYFYFGIGESPTLESPKLSAVLSAWRPPLVVVDLALDSEGRGRYAVRQRPPAAAVEGKAASQQYSLRFDVNAIQRYSWCTPSFILGTLMHEAKPVDYWVRISCQNRWCGVIFAGHPDGRIVPQVQARDNRTAVNSQWSVQSKGTLVCQKLKESIATKAMRVWFSKPGLTNRVEENGWVFVESRGAYAAVRAVRGKTSWEPAFDNIEGEWLRCSDDFTPVILEVAEKKEFADYVTFRQAVAALPLKIDQISLTYRSLGGDEFVFFLDQSTPPTVNGKPVDYRPEMGFDSPFVQSNWDSGVVTIAKGQREVVLDFSGNSAR
ncbi:MAG: hypothetical protein ACOY3P_10185 [Planctomycetota bacterium]